MINAAIKKINEEIEKEKNPYVRVIGEYLSGVIRNNESAAEKVLDKDKSIMKSLDEMRKAAEKVKVGNMAILSDEEGFKVVLKYFGIDRESKENKENENIKVIDFKSKKEEKEEILNISLDDYL